jgi:hypothetical protein
MCVVREEEPVIMPSAILSERHAALVAPLEMLYAPGVRPVAHDAHAHPFPPPCRNSMLPSVMEITS